MKKNYTTLLFICLQLVFAISVNSEENERLNYKPEKIIIKTKKELKISEATGKISLRTGVSSFDKIIEEYSINKAEPVFRLNNGDAELFEKLGMSRIYVLHFDTYNSKSVERAVKDFSSEDFVEFSEPVFIGEAAGKKELKLSFTPNDEMFSKQWYLNNEGQIPPTGRGNAKIGADINIINAWDVEKGSDKIIVAILDSGIKDDHPDLKNRIWVNEKEIPDNGIDDDDNGYIDDYKGWDFAYEDNTPTDGFGHGTNIASVIGCSTNNAIGFAGVNQKCKLMNCKNLSSNNNGEYIWWAQSIKYAVDNGANIINMSEGGSDYSKTLKTAIDYAIEKNILICAAMMNKGDDQDYYPASIKGVFAIGATDTDDTRCLRFTWGGGSCWGKHISVVAPGNKIYGLDYENVNNYESMWSGTSQSTAIVSGIASLLLSQKPSRTAEELKGIITSTAKDLVGDTREDKQGWDKYYGYGRVDTYAALTYSYMPVQNKNKEEQDKVTINEKSNTTNGKQNDSAKEEKAKRVQKIDEDDVKESNANTPEPSKKK
ncbi:MAG: S8 family serine peptidase [Ignavibacteria bacterium]|nr:S8 family serine peptidase [Ignavibacteria bacterium]